MCRDDVKLDPFTQSSVDNIVPATLSIQILSGQFLTDKHVGTFGNTGCFSFYPTKNITSIEGGMVITNSKKIAKSIISFSLVVVQEIKPFFVALIF